jgi:hypothetical protein
MNIVQTAKSRTTTNVVGGNFGAGTRAFLSADCSFTGAVTAGNTILAFVTGRIPQAGSTLTLGPDVATSAVPGGTGGLTYYVQGTYVLLSGVETPAGPEVAVVVPGGQSLQVSSPSNPFAGPTGAFGWNVYIGLTSGSEQKQNSSTLNFSTFWVTGSAPTSGAAPPSSPVHDSVGNSYTMPTWVDGIYFGTAVGQEAMGVFVADSVSAGTPMFTWVGACHNANPIFGVNVDIDIILAEVADFSGTAVQDAGYYQQNTSTGIVSVSLAGVSGSIVTDYGPLVQDAVTVIDFNSSGQDVLFALLTGDHVPAPVTAPSLSTGLYTLVDSIPEPGFPLYVWFSGPRKQLRPQVFVWT